MTEKQFNARKNTDDDFEERLKVKLEEIVGLVETDEETDSVEVKKEYYNSKSINKRYNAMFNKYCGLVVADMSTNPRICSARRISDMEIVDELNSLSEENEQLKKENEELKKIISKIDFAIIRKYDNSLENLLDEVYDGEYDKWIDKQVLRAKKLGGDVE